MSRARTGGAASDAGAGDALSKDPLATGGRAARRGGSGTGGSRAAARRNRRGKRKKTVKIISISTATVLVLALGGAYYEYQHLSGNITADSLYNGTKKSTLAEKPDAFGRTPLNVLVIGSDTRDTAEDCSIGGDCADGGGGANADVEMVVHLSADRSNATVMSIPGTSRPTSPPAPTPRTRPASAAAWA